MSGEAPRTSRTAEQDARCRELAPGFGELEASLPPAALLEALVEHAQDQLVFLDRRFNVVRANRAYADAAGKSPDELAGCSFFELVCDAEIRTAFERVRDRGEPTAWREKPITFVGQPTRGVTYWDCTITPVKDEAGSVLGLVVSQRDVTDKVGARRKVEDSEHELRAFFENVSVGAVQLRRDGSFLRINDRYCQITGYSRDELLAGMHPSDLTHPDDRPRDREFITRALDGNWGPQNVQKRVIRKDGSIIWVSVTSNAVRDDEGILRAAAVVQDITERKRAEEELRASEERLSLAVAASGQGLWDWDLTTDTAFLSPEYLRLSGYTEGHVRGARAFFRRNIHPDDLHSAEKVIEEHLRGETPRVAFEYRMRKASGALFWARVLGQVTARDASGAPLRLTGVIADVTERRSLEEELRERHALLLEAGHLVGFGYWDRDLRTGKSFWSDEIYRILGHAPGSFVPVRDIALDAMPQEDRERIDQHLAATACDGVTRRAECRVIDTHGTVHSVYGSVELLRDSSGAPARLIGTLQDLTDRKRAEDALRESEERFRTMADSAPVMIWVVNHEGDNQFVNRAYCRFFGKNAEEVEGSSWQPLLHPDDAPAYLEAARAALLERKPFSAHVRVRHREGDWRWIESYAVPRLSPAGEFLGMVGTSADITARKAMEGALAESNRRKDEFLAVLSHELRNPLAPVCSSLHVLARAEPGGEQARRMQAIIERQVSHLTRLVDDLLDVTRISRGKMQLQRGRIELGELVRRTVEDHRSAFTASGIQIEGRVASSPMWIDADATRVAQVVGNLLGNAAKFTPNGGRVEVTLEQEGGSAVLRVHDNGVGISGDVLDRVFEPFTQADRTLDRARGGLGLGLALVKGLVELHGGSVAAASAGPGRGSELTVRLPLTAPTEEPASPEEKRPARPRRVLIIEDNADAAASLKEALELDGHRVQVAYDGPQGLATARASRPDVVLCDIGLPGMSGYEVARALRADEASKDSLLVALTGYALPEDMQRAQQAGFQRHLAKPPSFEELEQLLADAPSRPADGGAAAMAQA